MMGAKKMLRQRESQQGVRTNMGVCSCLSKSSIVTQIRSQNFFQVTCKIICAFPEDVKKIPLIRVSGKDFEGTGNIFFGQPGSLACKVDEGDVMINCNVLPGEVGVGN